MYFVRQWVGAYIGKRSITPMLCELFIHGERAEIVVNGSLIITHTNKDMGRHMYHVTPNGQCCL